MDKDKEQFDDLAKYAWWRNIAWVTLITIVGVILGVIIGLVLLTTWLLSKI